jgi:hypothetical protein
MRAVRRQGKGAVKPACATPVLRSATLDSSFKVLALFLSRPISRFAHSGRVSCPFAPLLLRHPIPSQPLLLPSICPPTPLSVSRASLQTL